MKDLILKKCNHCKAIVKVVNDCNCDCGFVCCGEKMVTIKHISKIWMKTKKNKINLLLSILVTLPLNNWAFVLC